MSADRLSERAAILAYQRAAAADRSSDGLVADALRRLAREVDSEHDERIDPKHPLYLPGSTEMEVHSP